MTWEMKWDFVILVIVRRWDLEGWVLYMLINIKILELCRDIFCWQLDWRYYLLVLSILKKWVRNEDFYISELRGLEAIRECFILVIKRIATLFGDLLIHFLQLFFLSYFLLSFIVSFKLLLKLLFLKKKGLVETHLRNCNKCAKCSYWDI